MAGIIPLATNDHTGDQSVDTVIYAANEDMLMESPYTPYIEQLDRLRDDVRQILLGLDERSLNWRPNADMLSIYILAQRSIWFEQGMIGQVWGQRTIAYGWPTDDTLPDADDDASDLLFMLDEAATLTEAVISAADPFALDQPLNVSQRDEAQAGTPHSLIQQVIEQYTTAIETMRQTRQEWDTSQGA